MVPAKHLRIPVKGPVLFIYCLIVFCAAIWSVKKPSYNWDMLPYMGIVLLYDQPDINIIHRDVYAIAKTQVPPVFYNRMIEPSNTYRNSVAQSPEIFRSQLPFYIVKPLYTGAAWLFYKAGVALPVATVLPSALAYFLTGLLLLFWLRKYWADTYAAAGSLLIMFSPPLLTVAGLSTPDALSALLLFTAIYFLTEKRSFALAFVFLLTAVFARLDNILPAAGVLSVVFFTGKWKSKFTAVKIITCFSLLFLAYFIVSYSVRSFGWSVFFYPAFLKQLNSSYAGGSTFNFSDYTALAKSQLITGLYFSFTSLFFFLVLFLLCNAVPVHFNRLTMEQALAILFVLIMLLRFMLQPLVTDRLYIPYYLSVLAFLVKVFTRHKSST